MKNLAFFIGIILFMTVTSYGQGVGINSSGAAAHTSAMLDVTSTTGGLLLPRMTLVQRDAIASPAEGLIIYQTDNTPGFYHYDGSAWVSIGSSGGGDADWIINSNDMYSGVSGNVGIGSATPNSSSKLDVTSTVSGFLPPRMITAERNQISSPAEGLVIYNTDINCLEIYRGSTIGWWNACSDGIITMMTCDNTLYYDTVQAAGYTWFDRNLGAQRVATAFDDYVAYGSHYQWGRSSDGHECINWTSSTTPSAQNGSTSTLSTSDNPGHSLFILNSSGTFDWRNPQNNSLWQGLDGINNPCPSGYRIPTWAEFLTLSGTFSSQDYFGGFNSPLKISIGGIHNCQTNTFWFAGSIGQYWSSTINGSNATSLGLLNNFIGPGDNHRAHGHSIRCIKD